MSEHIVSVFERARERF